MEVAREITVFMLVTNFAYSCKSSCSRGVNCGGGEFGCEVDRDSVEVMLWTVVLESDLRRVEVEKIGGGQEVLRFRAGSLPEIPEDFQSR